VTELHYGPPELNFTPERIAFLREFCGLPPGDQEPSCELLLLVIEARARQFCGLTGDREVQPGDVALMRAVRAIIDCDDDP
jgi:hypothetical protein